MSKEDSEQDTEQVTSELSVESIRAIGESIGISNLNEDVLRELADNLTHRLRVLIQDSSKYMFHGKRNKLVAQDFDLALQLGGQEPLYGISVSEPLPFKFASGGGRELHFKEEKDVDLENLLASSLPKIPLGPSIRGHWLAIDGIQPMIPENPPAQSKKKMKTESANPLSKLKHSDASENKLSSLLAKLKNTETVNVKQLATHELSVEQQLYYKEITEACVGSDESRRAEALQSLASDPGLHSMLPRLCTFIAEGVRVNVVQHNLAILIYLMRMVKSVLENSSLFLEKYLHELIPAVTTCIVSRQLCSRPDIDNHWALRDFASRLMANICKNFNTSTNNIQTRITRMFTEALTNESSPLVSYYGAIAGLLELGPEVMKAFILPTLKDISLRIDRASEGSSICSNVEKAAAKHISASILKFVAPVLKGLKGPQDSLEDYKEEFGSLGVSLHASVTRSRLNSSSSSSSNQSVSRIPGRSSTTNNNQTILLLNQSGKGPPSSGSPRLLSSNPMVLSHSHHSH